MLREPGTEIWFRALSYGKLEIMNLYDAILRDDPVAVFKFGTTPATSFPNLMNDSAVMTVPQNGGVNAAIYPGSMISGPGNSLVLGAGWYGLYTFNNRFNKDFTGLPFSIEMVIKLSNPTAAGATLLATHTSSTDGFYFDGVNLTWAIDLDGGGRVETKWPVPDLAQNYHVVGTYNKSRIILYVDGVEVSAADIPEGSLIASEALQQLYIAYAPSRQVLVEAPAFYDKELSASQVASHFVASRQNIPALDAVAAYGGRLFKFTDNEREVLFRDPIVWATEGKGDNVAAGDYLRPVYGSDDLSQAGTFTYSINSADLNAVTLYQGVKLDWDGDGNFTVEVSINNGSSWFAVVNGTPHANTIGMSAQIPPMVRITFTAGRAKDLDVVRSMTATVYSSLLLTAVNDSERTMILSGTNASTSSYWAEPIEMDDYAGGKINQSHAILQESTQTDLTNIGTLEMWVRMDTLPSGYLFDSRSMTPSNPGYLWRNASSQLAWPATFSAVYVNGVAITSATFVPVSGQWYHIVVVYATPHNAKIDFLTGLGSTYTNQMNMVAHYEAQLTAAQVLALYKSYFGPPALEISDANTIVVAETAPAAKAYVNDWSIQGAG